MSDLDSIVERRISEAAAQGAFDDLPGSGRPLPGKGRRDDPDWWVRSFLDRQRARERAAQRLDQLERAVGSLWPLTAERQVRARLATINQEMAEINATLSEPEQREEFDADAVVAAWRRMTRARLRRDR